MSVAFLSALARAMKDRLSVELRNLLLEDGLILTLRATKSSFSLSSTWSMTASRMLTFFSSSHPLLRSFGYALTF